MENILVEKIYTIDDLADYLKLSRRTIYRMLEDNELPFAIKIKGSWRFREADIQDWLKNNQVGV